MQIFLLFSICSVLTLSAMQRSPHDNRLFLAKVGIIVSKVALVTAPCLYTYLLWPSEGLWEMTLPEVVTKSAFIFGGTIAQYMILRKAKREYMLENNRFSGAEDKRFAVLY